MRRFFLLTTLLLAAASAMAATPLRIMTFNAEWLVGNPAETDKAPWKDGDELLWHYNQVASVIETANPDILCLNEVTCKDAVQRLADMLKERGLPGYHVYHIESGDWGTGQDVAFLSKIEADTVGGAQVAIFYSHDKDSDWRVDYSWTDPAGKTQWEDTSLSQNAVVYFTVGGRKLGFLGLHTKAFPDDPKANGQRTGQSLVAQRIVRDKIVALGYTPIVMGDVNDFDAEVPDAEEKGGTMTKVLANLKDYDPKSDGPELVNAASLIPREADRYTYLRDMNKNEHYDEGDTLSMIDHILLPKAMMPMVKRVFIDHGHSLETSDHWPVIVDLMLE